MSLVKVFISYGGNIDKPIAKLLADYLVKIIGKDCIYCTAIMSNTNSVKYGEDFVESYMKNIGEAQVFIQLLSPSYLNSQTALIEMGAAYALHKSIIPFIISGGDYSQLQNLYNVRNREMYHLENKKGFKKAITQLAEVLGETINTDDEEIQELIKKVKDLDSKKRTLLAKNSECSFVCKDLFDNPIDYIGLIDSLGRKKIINICVNKIYNNIVESSSIYLYGNKTVEDFRNVIEEKIDFDFETNPIEE